METVLSGIRPTGNLHLGNYFGAIKNFIRMQDEYNCYFFIADYHSLTTHPHPENLQQNVKQVLVEYLASGINPETATIYVQSDLPETAELYLFLNMNAYLGELERCTTFKDKVRKHPENVNAGLLTYPTLMAADILIHKADKVPVGNDQKPHLELTRLFASRFNRMYGIDYFKEPEAYNFDETLVKIPGLDGSTKMGKSEGNAIYLNDEPEMIRKKIMRAKTDAGPTAENQPKSPEVMNLFTLMKYVSSPDTLAFFEQSYNNCSIRYGDMKKQLAEDVINVCEPVRMRINDLSNNTTYLEKVMRDGAEKARINARKTLSQVREIIGFKN
ncbi:MAG: tryptophan--tRNA ligase [Bacteroidales bacterium]|jgi:tryptophanyl-tRNA synthetase|nr:tryptophan--tRNA ligase [Bacteroidales bacterium]